MVIGEHLAGRHERARGIVIGQLTRPREQHVDRLTYRQGSLDHLVVEVGKRPAHIHHDDKPRRLLACLGIVAE